jgi:hypothetical protein
VTQGEELEGMTGQERVGDRREDSLGMREPVKVGEM